MKLGTDGLAVAPCFVVINSHLSGEGDLFEAFKGHTSPCQQRTLEQWEIRGELTASERRQLMQLLCQIDGQACLKHDDTTHQQDR